MRPTRRRQFPFWLHRAGATTSPTESLEPPTTTEETIIAGEESTQATETTEETTAFQAPEGTPTSSTARIVCLRADQGASPPTKSTEAVNRGVFTRVLTPKVAARSDGVHYRIDNRLGKAPTYTSDPTRQPFVEIPIPKGVSHRAELFPLALANSSAIQLGMSALMRQRVPTSRSLRDIVATSHWSLSVSRVPSLDSAHSLLAGQTASSSS